jgi:hypothetical protein
VSRIKLKYVHEFVDRHGKARFYLRRAGFRRVPLPGIPGSAEFMDAYGRALADTPRVEIGAKRVLAGSVGAMIVGYLGSAAFQNLATSSQLQYRRIFEAIGREHGHRNIASLERRHVAAMVEAKADTPAAARDFLRCHTRFLRHQDRPARG